MERIFIIWEQSEKNILVIGHRGARALYPENTMVSFRGALAMGVDGIETDIHMTSDGRLVLIHDDTVDRTTNFTGSVADFTFAQLRALDAGERFSPEYAGEKIPSFEEFLDLVKGKGLLLNIEIKDYRPFVVDRTIAMLDEFGLADTFVIACFDSSVTTYAHERYGVKTQGFPLHYLKNYHEGDERHYYSVGIGMKDLTLKLCRDYRAAGVDPWCWCPDDEPSAARAAACGVSLATCNDPGPALRFFKSSGLHA